MGNGRGVSFYVSIWWFPSLQRQLCLQTNRLKLSAKCFYFFNFIKILAIIREFTKRQTPHFVLCNVYSQTYFWQHSEICNDSNKWLHSYIAMQMIHFIIFRADDPWSICQFIEIKNAAGKVLHYLPTPISGIPFISALKDRLLVSCCSWTMGS